MTSAPVSPDGSAPPVPRCRPSGIATASLVCGFLGLCTLGMTAVPGIILGIVTLRRAQDAGGLASRRSAASGIVLSAISLILSAGLLAFWWRATEWGNAEFEYGNMKALLHAAYSYSRAHQGRLPPGDSWPTMLRDECNLSPENMVDPRRPDAGRAYAMNSALSEHYHSSLATRTTTVLFFECRPGSPAAGGRELLPEEPRYKRRGYIIGFADLHAENVPPEEIDKLRWAP